MILGVQALVAALVGGALVVGCSRGDDGAPAGRRSAAAEVTLTGAGATFPYPLYTRWISEFEKEHRGVRINYQSIGSGGGIRQLTEHTVDFGATDAPMSDEQMAKAPGVLHIPTCLGAVVLSYNLPGVPSGLHLTPEAAAGIFLGTVVAWSDPAIQNENPGTPLPNKRIVAVHRSDGSGTTRLFTGWLAAESPTWQKGPGAGMLVEFPSGRGAKGNEGVAAQVSGTPFAVGYVELVYAAQNSLPYAAVRNAAGAFVMPTAASITAAGAGALARMPGDLRGGTAGAGGEGAYPLAGFSFVLLTASQPDRARGQALVDFLSWAVHAGQDFAEPLQYARLPAGLIARIDDKLASVTGPDGRPLLASTGDATRVR